MWDLPVPLGGAVQYQTLKGTLFRIESLHTRRI